jgi:hypothetical protein
MPWNMVYAKILSELKDFNKQIMYAIQHMGTHTGRFRDHAWLLHHPLVCRIAYEELVGPSGGGDSIVQRSVVQNATRHLGAWGEEESIVEGLYDTNARTFHKGRIGAWKSVFTELHICEFERKYADILSMYGYA